MEQTLFPPRPEAPDPLGAATLHPSAAFHDEQTSPPRGAVTTPRGVSFPFPVPAAPELLVHLVPQPDNHEQTSPPAGENFDRARGMVPGEMPVMTGCNETPPVHETPARDLSAFPLSRFPIFTLPCEIPGHLLSPDPAAAARATAAAHAKLKLLERAAEIRAAAAAAGETLDQCQVAAALGLSKSTFHKIEAKFIAGGPLALLDKKFLTGRRPKFLLTENESLVLRGCVLARSSEGQLRFLMAMEDFLTQPACLPITREFMRAELDAAAREQRDPVWPPYLRRLGYPTREERAMFRGKKNLQQYELVDRRAQIWIDEAGNKFHCAPHSIWEMDDCSEDMPYASANSEPETPNSKLHNLNRQTLRTLDVYSNAILGFSQVARARDSYRIEDVACHVRDSVLAWGWPEILRLEMGEIWNGSFFHGIKVTAPGWGDERWGGLKTFCRVVNTFKSKGKGQIEGSFNTTHALGAHAGLTIGRTRGEFEQATKSLIRAHQTGDIDPRFFTADESAQHLEQIALRYNLRPQTRRAFGLGKIVPADVLRNQRGRPALTHEHWVFSPIKREATVRNGHVEITINHYPQSFRFRVNGVDDQLHLDHGWSVLVAFHPGHPEQGCHVFNAEIGARNRHHLRAGERLILAPYAEDVPQVDFSGRADFTPRKKANAAVRRTFIAIGQAMRAQHHAQDSYGQPTTTLVEPVLPQLSAGAPVSQPAFPGPVNPWREKFSGEL